MAMEGNIPTEMDIEATCSKDDSDTKSHLDCSICLQDFIYPVKLPDCGHIFCFLCIKGVVIRSGKCPMCRCRIAARVLDKPDALRCCPNQTANIVDTLSLATLHIGDSEQSAASTAAAPVDTPNNRSDDDHDKGTNYCYWFYEGRNEGWWRYDERTEGELEAEYRRWKNDHVSPTPLAEFLIAGHVYVIDFERMLQYRKDGTGRKRRMKHETTLTSLVVKGVAGLTNESLPSPSLVEEKLSADNSQDNCATDQNVHQ